MAFNPTPEVAAARDFGRTFGWDQVVILHLNTVTRRMGYASYGETKALCAGAKVLADVAMEAVVKFLKTGERP